ncbi:MAG: hypothetical protein JOZ39_08330 [Chloroflexi bacterium]|nr:hypothetical protein [Chloroflexota bacterium]
MRAVKRAIGIPFRRLASHLTGFSTPVFGVSWEPPTADVDLAKQVLARLEDRRVLYAPETVEIPSHCVDSVLEIRHILTDALTSTGSSSALADSVRAMRAACRKFLDETQALRLDSPVFSGGYSEWIFLGALGEMRGVIGIHIAQICARYGIDVEPQLAAMLPKVPTSND